MKSILINILVLALVVPAMGIDNMKTFGRDNLTSDPWMWQGHTSALKPTHMIDGQTQNTNRTAASTSQLGAYSQAYAQQNGWVISGDKMVPGAGAKDRGQWDQYLSGVPMAECDTSLKTSDPMYLSMGARPIVDQSNLPLILQGLA